MEDAFVYKQVASWDTDEVIKWMNGKPAISLRKKC